MVRNRNKVSWYIGGLHFECLECGSCCSGPDEGYIWVTKPEIKLIAAFLKISVDELKRKYLKRVGLRSTVIEHPATRDCIFLRDIEGQRRCVIYKVRPNQCRNWPFWPYNLFNSNHWNEAAQRCPGINCGKGYSFEQIEGIKNKKSWWLDEE